MVWRRGPARLELSRIRQGSLSVCFGMSDGAGFWFEIQSEIQSESGLIRLNPTKKIAAGDEDLK
jgi:hypothetical protein